MVGHRHRSEPALALFRNDRLDAIQIERLTEPEIDRCVGDLVNIQDLRDTGSE